MSECLIVSLIVRPFSSRSLEEKMTIIENGRPTPPLPELTQNQMNNQSMMTRHFNPSFYEKYKWLTGSPVINAVFCWHCLLFGKDRRTSWTRSGFTHLSNLTKSLQTHEMTINHLQSSLSVASYGPQRTESDDQLVKVNRLRHQRVRRNRDILKRLVNPVLYLEKQAFRCRSGTVKSVNRVDDLERLKSLAKRDYFLAEHLEDSTVFKKHSNHVQNDLTEAVAATLLSYIKEEIKAAPFVTIIVDETTDVASHARFFIVFRYVYCGKVKERFMGFSDLSAEMDASAISELISKYVNDYDCKSKLVGITMSRRLPDLQELITSYPQALYLQCYAHDLNTVLLQSVKGISKCRSTLFFSTLNSLAAYFTLSPLRTDFLEEFLIRRLPDVCPTIWDYSSRLVKTVYEHRYDLCRVFETMLEHADEIEMEILSPIAGFHAVLNDFQFVYLLNVFAQIFDATDTLFKVLRNQASDTAVCRRNIEYTQEAIRGLRWENNERRIWEAAVAEVGAPAGENAPGNYYGLYCEIIDAIDTHVQSIREDYSKIDFLQLLAQDEIEGHRKSFPEIALTNLLVRYCGIFDSVRLRNELIVFYGYDKILEKDLNELASIFSNDIIRSSFHSIFLLVNLLLTLPVTTNTEDGSLSAVKRIKTFSRKSRDHDHFSNLALLSVESDLLSEIQTTDKFLDLVVDKVSEKGRMSDLQ